VQSITPIFKFKPEKGREKSVTSENSKSNKVKNSSPKGNLSQQRRRREVM